MSGRKSEKTGTGHGSLPPNPSSQGINIRRRRREVCRRTWSSREEAWLLEGLKFCIADGMKSDNGFRHGYLQKLEIFIKRFFPDTDLKANPHIQSRLTKWKKNYASLTTILSRSGVGFNCNGDHQVNCGDAEWEEIIKQDPNAATIREKKWPLLEGWREVFGKDWANRQGAEDVLEFVEILEEPNQEATMDDVSSDAQTENLHGSTQPRRDKGILNDEDDPSVCMSSKEMPSSSKKKRKGNDTGSGSIIDVLGQIRTNMNTRFGELINKIGYHYDVADMRKEVYDLIKMIPDLSLNDNFIAADKIIGKVERLQFFLALPESDRAKYVKYVLNLKD